MGSVPTVWKTFLPHYLKWANKWIQMFMNKFLNFILNLFLLRLLESPTLLTILHYVPTLGFMWHTLRTGFTCSSSRLNLKFVDTDESSPPSHQLLVHSDSSALRPLGSHQPAAPPPLVTWLSMGDDLPCWQAALNQKKEKRKKKKNAPKTLAPKSVWFSRFTCWNKHDFILLVLLIEMSCLLLKL